MKGMVGSDYNIFEITIYNIYNVRLHIEWQMFLYIYKLSY